MQAEAFFGRQRAGKNQMSPKIRIAIATLVGLLLALAGAENIAGESYGLVALIAAATLWILVEWRTGARPEAWILAIVLFGYIVGNRGFAQFQFTTRIPLLPAETALLFCTAGLGFRAAISKTTAFRPDAVNITILLWVVYATARLPFGLEDFGVVALRDYALVYYAMFFYLSQYISRDPRSALLLDRTLTASFMILPLTVIIDKVSPAFFASYLSWNGVPLIYYKSDLIAASFVSGSFWFWSRFEISGRKAWLVPAAISILLIGIEESPRAALVAGAVVIVAWLYARRFRLVGFQVAVVAVGIAASIPAEMALGRPFVETKSYEMYERMVSIVDVNGSHLYRNSNSASATGNNQFRQVWWKSVMDETISTSPVLGLGFGYDLSARFLAEYDWLSVEEEFNTRSPHSVLFTNFGRLGALGLGLFLLSGAMMVRSGLQSFKTVDFQSMAWWSVAITIAVSACFGVVLENPMGAVIFWTALGIAHSRTSTLRHARPSLDRNDNP